MRLRNALFFALMFLVIVLLRASQSSAQNTVSLGQAGVPGADPIAEYNLGDKAFFSTSGTPHGVAEGIMLYRESAESGYIPAQKMLGGIFGRGIRVAKDNAEASHWYEMAAEQGDKDSQSELGRLYEEGEGVRKNLAIAAYWYSKAEQQGDVIAKNNLSHLADMGVIARAPSSDQLPPKVSAYPLASLEYDLQKALLAEKSTLQTSTEAPRVQAPSQASAALPRPSNQSDGTCTKSIAFAIVQGRNVSPLIPDFADKWATKNQKHYPGLCFSQSPISGAQDYVFVFSTAQDSLSGFQPVVRTSTSTSTSPVHGSGNIVSNSGEAWQYTYNGTITTTTTTTSTEDVPYTLRESTLYLTIYNSYGVMVQQRWASDSRQIGGDPYQALGHNLGMALRSIHVKERLLKAGVKDITGR